MPAQISDDFTERLARSIHAAYVSDREAEGESARDNPSMAPWERLDPDLRHANLDQAADIGDKVTAINAVVIPASAAAPAFSFTDDEIERLAQQEHERWKRERIAQGWTYGPARDNDRKLHPDLRPWPDLDNAAKDKDRNAIRALPMIVRAAGFQIIRRPPN